MGTVAAKVSQISVAGALEIANAVEAVQDGRIYIERVNEPGKRNYG